MALDLVYEKFRTKEAVTTSCLAAGLGTLVISGITRSRPQLSNFTSGIVGVAITTYITEKLGLNDLDRMRNNIYESSNAIYKRNIWHRAHGELYYPKSADAISLESDIGHRYLPNYRYHEVDENDMTGLLMRNKISGFKTISLSTNTRHVRKSFLAQIGKPFLSDDEHKCLKEGKAVYRFEHVVAPHNLLEVAWHTFFPRGPFLLDIEVDCPAGQNPANIFSMDPHGDVSLGQFIREICFEAEQSRNTVGSFIVNIRNKNTDR